MQLELKNCSFKFKARKVPASSSTSRLKFAQTKLKVLKGDENASLVCRIIIYSLHVLVVVGIPFFNFGCNRLVIRLLGHHDATDYS